MPGTSEASANRAEPDCAFIPAHAAPGCTISIAMPGKSDSGYRHEPIAPNRDGEGLTVDTGASYSFGDTATAEERLDLLATVFDPPSRAFLASLVTSPPSLALDLGCGPGNTTRMIRDVTAARRVIGLDCSAAFTQSASARSASARSNGSQPADGGQPEFLVWDAADPLPVPAPDLIYARMLLAHLPAPERLAATWAGQLAPGGLLLLDEVEQIDTDSEVFTDYLTVVVARVRAAGADMYAGPLLGGIQLGDDCRVVADRVATHPVPGPDAALMFRLNLSVWGDDPWVAARFGPDTTARLDHELALVGHGQVGHGQVGHGQVGHAEISWRLRQLAIRRDGPG
jgi:trans-aconitate 2-methyltransferase